MLFSFYTLLSVASASSVIASALPVANNERSCPEFYLIEKWGTTVTQPSWNSSRFGTFKGCVGGFHSKRDGDANNPDTKVEINDDQVETQFWSSEDDTAPEDELWDRAVDELCGETYCDGEKQISTGSGRGNTDSGDILYLSLDGEFPDPGLRDNFITLLKDAFHKSVDEQPSPGLPYFTTHKSVAFGNAVTTYGDASGYSLTFRFSEGSSGSASCPGVVNTINSFGALVPELAPVFGFAAAICGIIG